MHAWAKALELCICIWAELRSDKGCLYSTAYCRLRIRDCWQRALWVPVWWPANINPITSSWTVAQGSQGGLEQAGKHKPHCLTAMCVYCGTKKISFFPLEVKYLTVETSDNYYNKVIADIVIWEWVWNGVQLVISLFECDAAKSIVHTVLW